MVLVSNFMKFRQTYAQDSAVFDLVLERPAYAAQDNLITLYSRAALINVRKNYAAFPQLLIS
jgi:hypothetical protein